ncbi:GPI-anchored surface protein, putative, partial [Bodo saltans]
CELRPHQLMILLHIALSTGAPRTMSKWLTRHEIQYRVELLQRQFYRRVTTTTNDTKSHTTATTTKGACFHPDAHTLEKIFWNSNLSLTPQRAEITEAMCIRAAELVAGFAACNIFHSGSDVEYRVFALDSRLAPFCTVTDVESTLSHSDKGNDEPGDTPDSVLRHTRVLVAPAFLRSLAASWPPSGCSSILTYIRALRDTLRHHARLATELVKVGKILVAHGGLLSKEEKKACPRLPICDQLIERWKATAIVGFEQLTFQALCLHLSCALEDDVLKTVASILARVCSSEPIEAAKIAVKKGRLECVDIPNFPSVFNDVFAESDAQLNSDDVFTRMNETLKADPDLCHRAKLKVAVEELSKNLEIRLAQPPTAGNTSHRRLQTSLAKGEHFCFRPSNPNNQGEDGVVFLRKHDAVPGTPPTWTVLLLQNKFWFYEIWRKKLTHLPATVVDTAGVTHTLRYVRILVTANPVEDSAFATSLSAKSLEERNKRIATIKRANDAFEKLDAAAFDSTRTAADEWVRKVVEENKSKLKTSHKHPIEDSQNKMNASGKENHRAKESQTNEDESDKHLRADIRAEWLLDHLKIEHPTAHDANLDPVICECHMHLDKITQWCPTVGLFLSNIMHIRNL